MRFIAKSDLIVQLEKDKISALEFLKDL